MPSKIDTAFIDNLQNFTNSLENIVELLKQQAKKGDAVNKMSASMDGAKLEEITKDIKQILDISKSTDNRTKEILKEIKAARQQKEGGIFEKIQSKDNKQKIVDGIKVVSLIAGGVLAIGLAFKIIGKVDFLSVIALSLSIMVLAKTFSQLVELKGLNPSKIKMVGLSLIMMSGALVLTSIILKSFQPLNPVTMLSLVLVSAGLGAGLFFISKALPNLSVEKKDLLKYSLLPFILPSIAAGMVLSSFILKSMQPIGLSTVISIVFVGLAIAAGAFATNFIMKALGDKPDYKKLAVSMAVIPLIAGGIVLSSMILQSFQPIKKPLDLLLGSIAMGVSMLAFVPTIYILGKMDAKSIENGIIGTILVAGAIAAVSWILNMGNYKGDKPEIMWSLSVGLSLLAFAIPVLLIGKLGNMEMLLEGSLGVLLVSATIMISSWILSIGSYEKYPSLSWALDTGLSILLFSPAILILGAVAMSGIGAGAIALGAAMTLIVAAAIVATSWILPLGKYDKYPSLGWALGTGASLIGFGAGIITLGMLAITGVGALAIILGAKMVDIVANSIVSTSFILGTGKYDKYPSLGWAMGSGLALTGFGLGIITLGMIAVTGVGALAIIAGTKMVKRIATSIKESSEILSTGTYSGGPTKEWSEGVALSISAFANALKISSEVGGIFSSFKGSDFSDFIKTVAIAMKVAAEELSTGKWDVNAPSPEWGLGVSNSLAPFINAYSLLIKDKSFIDSIFGGDDKDKFSNLMKSIAHAMVEVDTIFAGGTFANAPGETWSSNISTALTAFTDGISKIDDDKIEVINDFSDAIKNLAKSIEKLNSSGIEKLQNLTASVTIMSAIDQNNLNKVLGVLNENKSKLSNIIESRANGVGGTTSVRQPSTQISSTTKSGSLDTVDPQEKMLEKFDLMLQKMDTLIEYTIQSKGGSNVNTKDKVN